MDLPVEFSGRVCKTRLNGLTTSFKRLNEVVKEWQGSEVDVIYEDLRPIVVVVFETSEDCLAFKLKYGNEYV